MSERARTRTRSARGPASGQRGSDHELTNENPPDATGSGSSISKTEPIINKATPPHCPPELLPGAKKISVGPGLTGLLWTGVRTQLSTAARQYLRDTFPAVAVQAFTGTTREPGSPARSGERCCGRRSSGPPRTASMR